MILIQSQKRERDVILILQLVKLLTNQQIRMSGIYDLLHSTRANDNELAIFVEFN